MTAKDRDQENETDLLRRQISEFEQKIARLEAEAAEAKDLKAANQALQQKEAMYARIVDAMEDMVLVKGERSHIVFANRAFREFYGMTMEELHDIIDAPFNQEEWTHQYLIDDAYVMKTGNVLSIEEEPVTRFDGIVRFFNTIKSPIFTGSEAVLTVGVSRDITERKELERRVNEFNSMVSHELRTPLTAIRAALGLIEGGQTEPISPTNMDLVCIARTECDRMIRLINDLLDIKKIAANKLEMRLLPLGAADIIGPVVASMTGMARECGIELITAVNDSRTFMGDRDRITQVVANLISNALKFSPAGTAVRLATDQTAEGMLRFSVSDRGPGIPEDEFDKLFVAFQQLDSSDSRAKGGTGLGLAISKAIVERHGGKIGFETKVGCGATFWFDLPAIANDGADPNPRSRSTFAAEGFPHRE